MEQHREEWEVMKAFKHISGKNFRVVEEFMKQFHDEKDFLKTIYRPDNPVGQDKGLFEAALKRAEKLSVQFPEAVPKRTNMSQTFGGSSPGSRSPKPVLKTVVEVGSAMSRADKNECTELNVQSAIDEKRRKELDEKENEILHLIEEKTSLQKKYDNKSAMLKEKEEFCTKQEQATEKIYQENSQLTQRLNQTEQTLAKEKEHSNIRANEALTHNLQLKDHCKELEKDLKWTYAEQDRLNKDHQRELNEIRKERDELKTRFSKLAGAKLHDNNADIADLSDPNRAMKLSEKFSQLYDDEWTDVYEEIIKNKYTKMTPKEATGFIIKMLQKAFDYCAATADVHFERLKQVVLHPLATGTVDAKARVKSREEKMLKEARRQIATYDHVVDEIKMNFIAALNDPQFKEHVRISKPFLARSVEICWMMVLHEPPLYMDMSVRNGDQYDPNKYTSNTASGKTVELLVWPPLYNGRGGGLLSKGVVSTQKTIGRK